MMQKRKGWFFLMFLTLSAVLWFLIKLSDSYASVVTYNLKYVNAPEGKLLLGKSRNQLRARVQGNGFQLLYAKVLKPTIDIDISETRKGRTFNYLLASDLEDQIKKQKRKIDVRRVLTDTLKMSLGVNKKKTLVIIPDTEFVFQKDYGFLDSMYVEPREIWVQGAEDAVDTINEIFTRKVILKNINSNLEIEVPLIKPLKSGNITLETDKVIIKGNVARFSEKIIKLPVMVENIPSDINIRLFPDEIEIVCRAPIDVLKDINRQDFKIVCDYNLRDANSPYLVPEIKSQPSFIKDVRLLQTKVEFLINRK